MRKIILHSSFALIFFSICFLFSNDDLHSQIQYGGIPFTVLKDIPADDIDVFTVALTEEMIERKGYYSPHPEPGEAMHAGFSLPADISPFQSGSWDFIGDSLQIWRLKISSPGAHALGLVFDDFELSENSRMFVYSEDKRFIIGAFDYRNNNSQNVFTTHIVPGDKIIIEYEFKMVQGESMVKPGKSPFNISDVIHITSGGGMFLDSGRTWGLGESGWCQVNINCPEGDVWQNHKRSVARMLMKVEDSYWWCTGALVNNTAQDTTPYFLSAAHCGDGAGFHDMIYWQFYFNFERPGCEDVGTPAFDMVHGCELISKGPLDGGSDFRLLLLRNPPPDKWKPYYSGWSVSESPSSAGVGIHHPAGDAKKISTYSTTLSSATVKVNDSKMAENSAWQVYWDETETNWGVPEGGSSGSPLFNNQGLIVGTLTGGTSDCSSPQKPDYYGKMSYHWESNDPDNEMKQLKPYLDPKNTGATILQGFDPYHVEHPPPGFLTANNIDGESVELEWYRPGSTPNKEGWYSHVTDYTHLTWQGPERATLFDAKDFDFTFPVTLQRVSHIFAEHQEHPWPPDNGNKFRFKIYGSDGELLMYSSPQLTAVHLNEYRYTLDKPLEIDEKFYVAVQPIHNSGHPSTLMKLVNYGAGHSFFGSPGNWTPFMDILNAEQFDFVTKIYITDQDGRSDNVTMRQAKPDDKTFPESEITESTTILLSDKYTALFGDQYHSPMYYRLYRDDDMIFQTPTAQTKTFVDEPPGYGFYQYHVTAVYEGGPESGPSNMAYVLLDEPCDEYIDEFPYKQIFAEGEPDDCWKIVEQSSHSWQFTTGYSTDNGNVGPVEGTYFVYVPGTDEEFQNEWLVTAPIDFSAVNSPALRFWFNGSYTSSVIDNNCGLKVYASVDEGAFHKIWDHTMHPGFSSSQNDYEWLQASVNLAEYGNEGNARIAFQYEGRDGANFAVDKIELIDASGSQYFVLLDAEPELSGMVTGEGLYMKGEPVTIKAVPNIEYTFQKWEKNGELFSSQQEHSFMMPANNLSLTAVFSSIISVEDETVLSEYIVGYPNPAKDKYNVWFNKTMKNVTIRVLNMQGIRLASYNYNIMESGNLVSIDLAGLTKGVYLVDVVSDDHRKTLKVSVIDQN